ncbi:hypothetical protein BHM03_00031941 [Ensete ventricosum]|nr:hypothetical protein BHM03_00031941 [Ensete ventricosum]
MVGPYFGVDVVWAASCSVVFHGWWDGLEIRPLTSSKMRHALSCFLDDGTVSPKVEVRVSLEVLHWLHRGKQMALIISYRLGYAV